VTRARKNRERERSWPVVLAALAVFGLLGSLSLILTTLHVHLEPEAATSSHGVRLLKPPRNPAPVTLPAAARPISPSLATATLPTVSSAKETAMVASEDARIRAVLHDAARTYQPEVIPYRGSLPTLVLPAGSHTYTTADLVEYGAMVMLPHDAALLLDNVFVSSNARLSFGSPLRTLYLDNTSGGFATIVGWGGSLSFAGTAAQPLTIVGWNRTSSAAATEQGNGRSYLRDVGGTMTLTDVRATSLGFWSGRTGGVAWTGVSAASSKGGAIGSTFINDTYGAFVSRGQDVSFSADLFEFNQLDGLHIHRYSVGSQVVSSSAARNGGNGFLVDRATQNTVLRGDVSQHNAANGYYVDGRPLVTGASASGGSDTPSSGTVIEDSAATGNAHTGVLIEGGTGTVVRSDQICSTTTALALRTGVTNAVLTGNDIRCHPRSGFSVGPSAPGTVISGNTLSGPRIGMLIRNSGPVTVDNNRLIGATVFGVTARGATSKVKGIGNVISGTGFRAVDARADATTPTLAGTDISGWAHRARITFFSYLEFHPLAALWLGILVLIVLAAAWSFRRKLPSHPYPVSTKWGEPFPAAGRSIIAPDPGPARTQPAASAPARQQENAEPARHAEPVRQQAQPATWQAPSRPEPVSRPRPAFYPSPTPARPSGDRPAPERPAGPPAPERLPSVFQPAPVRRPPADPDPLPWPEPATERISVAWSRHPPTRPQLAISPDGPGRDRADWRGETSPRESAADTRPVPSRFEPPRSGTGRLHRPPPDESRPDRATATRPQPKVSE
jgi:hypothetical protein